MLLGLLGLGIERAPQLPVPTATFSRLTNGVPGNTDLMGLGSVASFARLYPQSIRHWLANGTNAAVFVISNSLDRPIDVFPIAQLKTTKDQSWGQQMPLLLHKWQSAGVTLNPGKTAAIQVALLTNEGPCQVQFSYMPTPRNEGLYKSLVDELNGKARLPDSRFIYTDWFMPAPEKVSEGKALR